VYTDLIIVSYSILSLNYQQEAIDNNKLSIIINY
jgi:hypothetical protein